MPPEKKPLPEITPPPPPIPCEPILLRPAACVQKRAGPWPLGPTVEDEVDGLEKGDDGDDADEDEDNADAEL